MRYHIIAQGSLMSADSLESNRDLDGVSQRYSQILYGLHQMPVMA